MAEKGRLLNQGSGKARGKDEAERRSGEDRRKAERRKPETKVCSKCKEEKSVSEFYRDSMTKNGLRYSCIQCVKEYQKSEKGKAAYKRYRESEKGRASMKRGRAK